MIVFKQHYAPRSQPGTPGLNVAKLHYIATRPGAVYNQGQSFGLWGQLSAMEGPVVQRDLAKAEAVMRKASAVHTVYDVVVSVSKADGEQYGMNDRRRWEDICQRPMERLARERNIAPQDLRWVASFHAEAEHPHIHIMYWDDGTGIQPEGMSQERMTIFSERMREAFGREIYQVDLAREQQAQAEAAGELRLQMRALFREANPTKGLTARIMLGRQATGELARDLIALARAVPASGSLRYGYLPPELKKQVDELTDRCLQTVPELENTVQAYKAATRQICEYYGNADGAAAHYLIKAMGKLRKELGNEVMNAVRDLLSSDRSFLDGLTSPQVAAKLEPTEMPDARMPEVPTVPPDVPAWGGAPRDIHVADNWWSGEYSQARRFLYGSEQEAPDFDRAAVLLEQAAARGNGFAAYDRGKMYLKGLGCEADEALAQQWFTRAYQAIAGRETVAFTEKEAGYLQFRLGKLASLGHGTPEDPAAAAAWWQRSVDNGNIYGAYALAGAYRRGQGVDADGVRAAQLYEMAAQGGNAYAAYEMGRIYREGIGRHIDPSGSARWYAQAYQRFVEMAAQDPDDRLYYRLGRMCSDGVGTEKDLDRAEEWFQKAVSLNSDDGRYGLARLYLTHEFVGYAPEDAQKLLTEAAENGHSQAQYLLGKLLLQGDEISQDTGAAVEWLEKARAQENTGAAAVLGKAYLTGEQLAQDLPKAVELLTWAVAHDSSQAGYILGKAYLTGEQLPADPQEAEKLLTWSCSKGNEYAAIALARAYLSGEQLAQDTAKALTLLRQPAENENTFAQYFLGKALTEQGTAEALREGISWLSEAAAHDSDIAQTQLGILYFFGKDGLLERDEAQGLSYLQRAADHGNDFAQELLDRIGRTQTVNMMCAFMRTCSQFTGQQQAKAALGSMRRSRELSKEARKDRQQEQALGSGIEMD